MPKQYIKLMFSLVPMALETKMHEIISIFTENENREQFEQELISLYKTSISYYESVKDNDEPIKEKMNSLNESIKKLIFDSLKLRIISIENNKNSLTQGIDLVLNSKNINDLNDSLIKLENTLKSTFFFKIIKTSLHKEIEHIKNKIENVKNIETSKNIIQSSPIFPDEIEESDSEGEDEKNNRKKYGIDTKQQEKSDIKVNVSKNSNYSFRIEFSRFFQSSFSHLQDKTETISSNTQFTSNN